MKTESVKFDAHFMNEDDGGYWVQNDSTRNGNGNRNEYIKNEPSQLVISIKESIHQLRKILEEKKALDAANGHPTVNPSFNIPLNFSFKSFMEFRQAVRNKFTYNQGKITTVKEENEIKEIIVTSGIEIDDTELVSATLQPEQKMLSMKDVAYSNRNGHIHHERNVGQLPPVIHNPEEVQRITEFVKNYNDNSLELERARNEISKLQEQVSILEEERRVLEQEKESLTKTDPSIVVGLEKIESPAMQSTSKSIRKRGGSTVTDGKIAKRPKSVWRRVKKTSGRICFAVLESVF